MTVAEPLARPTTHATRSSATRRARPSRTGLLLGVTAFTVAALLSRQTVLPGGSFALVWPAAGVSLLWFLLRDARPRSADSAALAAAAFLANWLTGAPVALAAVLAVANVVQVLVHVGLIRLATPELIGRSPRLSTLQQLGTLVWTGGVAAAAAVATGTAGAFLVVGALADPAELVVWFGRLLAGSLVVAATGLVAVRCYRSRCDGTAVIIARRPLEAWTLGLTTLIAMGLVFTTELPLTFTLLVPLVWSAKRFPTVVAAGLALTGGVVAVVLTLLGQGPFTVIEDPPLAALTVQGYVTVLTMLCLFVAIGRDERETLLVELAAAHDESRHQAQLLSSIVDAMDEGVTAVDARGVVLLQNPAAMDLLEIDAVHSPDQLAHRGVTAGGQQIQHDRRPSVRALHGEHVHEDLLVQRHDSTTRHLRVSATPLEALSPDDVARAVMIFRDVTDEVEQEAALRAFAATVAHDLHNPLAAMIGWNEVMLEMLRSGKADPAELLRLGERLGGSADRLQELVDGLLEDAASKGRELDVSTVQLGDVVRDVARARGAEDFVTWAHLSAVRADRLLISQLLDNLIGNALKYVAPGTTPHVEVSTSAESPGWVSVEVADNGIGIPAGEHEHVFERFARAHSADARYQGTGLGLAIVQRIVARHDGRIAARQGQGGVGTVVEFTLPAA